MKRVVSDHINSANSLCWNIYTCHKSEWGYTMPCLAGTHDMSDLDFIQLDGEILCSRIVSYTEPGHMTIYTNVAGITDINVDITLEDEDLITKTINYIIKPSGEAILYEGDEHLLSSLIEHSEEPQNGRRISNNV